MNKKVNFKSSSLKKKSLDPHHWRLCPYGEHWVITHPMRVPPSEKNPNGSITTRKGHCAKNPSGKDQKYLLWDSMAFSEAPTCIFLLGTRGFVGRSYNELQG